MYSFVRLLLNNHQLTHIFPQFPLIENALTPPPSTGRRQRERRQAGPFPLHHMKGRTAVACTVGDIRGLLYRRDHIYPFSHISTLLQHNRLSNPDHFSHHFLAASIRPRLVCLGARLVYLLERSSVVRGHGHGKETTYRSPAPEASQESCTRATNASLSSPPTMIQ